MILNSTICSIGGRCFTIMCRVKSAKKRKRRSEVRLNQLFKQFKVFCHRCRSILFFSCKYQRKRSEMYTSSFKIFEFSPLHDIKALIKTRQLSKSKSRKNVAKSSTRPLEQKPNNKCILTTQKPSRVLLKTRRERVATAKTRTSNTVIFEFDL